MSIHSRSRHHRRLRASRLRGDPGRGNGRHDDVPFVGLDLAKAGYLAAQHLLSFGYTRFGYLIDRIGSLNGELRMSRYRSAIEDAGYEIDPAFIFEHSYARPG